METQREKSNDEAKENKLGMNAAAWETESADYV
jgi:hypothetical protein